MELWKCVTRNNVWWQTVQQPSTSSGEGSVSNNCALRLMDWLIPTIPRICKIQQHISSWSNYKPSWSWESRDSK